MYVSCDSSTIRDCHFYSEKKETIIKDIIWIIAAVGGIIVPFCFNKNTSMGAAYFLFSLSILMEFVPKISISNSLTGRVFHGLFCSLAIIKFILSIIMVLAQTNLFSVFLFIVCLITILFLLFDIGVALFAPNDTFENQSNDLDVNNLIQEQISVFLENFQKGNLGSLEGDDKK